MQIPTSLRRTATEMRYQEDKLNGGTKPLLEEPAIKEWEHWRLIDNRYPYDAVFSKHHMLVPLNGADFTSPELWGILGELENDYDFWFVNFAHRQSIKNLLHIHLVTHKPREEMFI